MKDSNNCQNPKVQNTALQQDDQCYSHQLPVVLVMWFVSLTHITLRVTLYKFSNCRCENRDLCSFNFISSAFVAKIAQLTAGSGWNNHDCYDYKDTSKSYFLAAGMYNKNTLKDLKEFIIFW